MSDFKGEKGICFTLLELLVVVAIIGILAAMLLPAFKKARAISHSTACKNNLHSLSSAINMYLQDSHEVMPVVTNMPSLISGDTVRIDDVLSPYLSNSKVFQCLADREKTYNSTTSKDKSYYTTEGSSYEFNIKLGMDGEKVSLCHMVQEKGASGVEVMYDYEPFHGKANTPGATNYLFVDGHVGDMN